MASGWGITLAAAAAGFGVHQALDILSPLTAALIIGFAVGSTPRIGDLAAAGARSVRRPALQVGVALLGLQLAVSDLGLLGVTGVAAVVVVVVTAYAATTWLGRVLGLSTDLTRLIASGFSICGASAVAAVHAATDADDDDAAMAVGLVTVFGTVAIVLLPAANLWLDLGPELFGAWVGASVHDVGQVVATASTLGATSLHQAVVVKLVRVLMLGPLIACAILARRRACAHRSAVPKLAVLPPFVFAFGAAVLLRSSGAIPPETLAIFAGVSKSLLAVALAAIGLTTRPAAFRAAGPRPLVVALLSWVFMCVVALVAMNVAL